MSISSKLEDCPFCGGAAHYGYDPNALECNYAGCADPGCIAYNLAYDFSTLDQAITAWNNRIIPIPTEVEA